MDRHIIFSHMKFMFLTGVYKRSIKAKPRLPYNIEIVPSSHQVIVKSVYHCSRFARAGGANMF